MDLDQPTRFVRQNEQRIRLQITDLENLIWAMRFWPEQFAEDKRVPANFYPEEEPEFVAG